MAWGVFCSKDWPYSYCAGKAPKLVYEINYPPYPAKPISPNNNQDFVGNCNQSVDPPTGNCSGSQNIDYKIGNIGDGEKAVTDSSNKTRVKVQLSHNNSSFWNLGGYSPSGYTYNQYSLTRNTPDGKYYWRGVTKEWLPSGQTATSLDPPQGSGATSTKYFRTDTTPPSIPDVPDLPEFFPGNQIEFDLLQQSTDNTAAPEEITYYYEVSDQLDFSNIIDFGHVNTAFSASAITFQIAGLADDTKYYYRVKARDRVFTNPDGNISAWSLTQSSTQDAILPIISDSIVDWERFSPSNPTSSGIKDEVKIQFDLHEKNFQEAKVEVRDQDNNLIRTIDSCQMKVGNDNFGLSICNSQNNNFPTFNFELSTLNFSWDGKKDDGSYAEDGPYTLGFVATDRAEQTNDLNLSEANKIVILDDTGANIGIVSPENDYWTNQEQVTFKGAVAGFNQQKKEDGDFLQLQMTNDRLQMTKDITGFVDASKNFEYSEDLQLGENKFIFETTDTVANRVNEVGDPAQVLEAEWVINHEQSHPEILEIQPQGLLNQGGNNVNPKIIFKVTDPDPPGDLSQTSDIYLGTNPKGYNLSLLRGFCDGRDAMHCVSTKGDWEEIPLFNNGNNVTSGGLASDLICTQTGSKGSEINCEVQLNNLQPDATYRIYLKIKDIAGNATCNKNYSEVASDVACNFMTTEDHPVPDKVQDLEVEFEVDSHTYLEMEKPVDNSVVNHSLNEFKGKGEANSQFIIHNAQLEREIRFVLNESYDGILPAEYDLVGNLIAGEGEASSARDLAGFENLPGLIVQCGFFQDIDSEPLTPDVELCEFSIILNQKDNYIGSNPDPQPSAVLNANNIKLTDEAGNSAFNILDLTVDLYAINLSSQPNLTHISPNGDGRQDGIIFENSVTNSGNANDITEIETYELSIYAKVTMDKIRKFQGFDALAPMISWDGKDEQGNWVSDGNYEFILKIETTDGVVVETLAQDIFVVGAMDDEVVITSPRDGYVTTRGVINVQGQSSFLRGNTTVEVCVDTILVPNSVSCDHVQTAEVDENGFWSTILILPMPEKGVTHHYLTAIAKDDYGNQTEKSNEVLVIVDTMEIIKDFVITPTFEGLNTQEKIDKFLAGEISLEEIRWLKFKTTVNQNTEAVDLSFADYTNLNELPNTDSNSGYSEIFGGIGVGVEHIATINSVMEDDLRLNPYQDFEVKKNHFIQGDLPGFQNLAGLGQPCTDSECLWIVNFPIPWHLSGGQYEVEAKGYKGESSESKTAGFVLDGRITAAPRILRIEKNVGNDNYRSLKEYQNKHYTNKRRIRLTGVADPEAEVTVRMESLQGIPSVEYVVQTAPTGIWQLELELPDEDTEYHFDLEAQLPDNPTSTPSERTEVVVLDRVNQGIESVQTSVPDKGINPWVNIGDRVDFEVRTKEVMDYCDVIKEDGFVKELIGDDMASLFHGSIVVNREEQGMYYSVIQCQDFAGNGKQFSNHDFQFPVNSQLQNFQKLILNPSNEDDYLYRHKPRGKSLDFRLFIDNTLPDKSEFDKENWSDGVDGVKADGLLPEQDRLIDQYVIRGNEITLSGYAEKYQRVYINWIRSGIAQERLGIVPIVETHCNASLPDENIIGKDNLVVKFAEKCHWSYTFEFPDNGQSPWGIPQNWYLLQAQVADLVGNLSAWNEEVTIYHDTDNPDHHEIINISSKSYNPVKDYPKRSITKDTEIKVEHSGERWADVQYQLSVINYQGSGKKKVKISSSEEEYTRLLRNGDGKVNYKGETSFELQDQVRDDKNLATCTTMDGKRRVGICSDGIYTVRMRMTDTAGNNGNWVEKEVERDTVRPNSPYVKVGKTGGRLAEYLSLEIKGEAEARALIKVRNSKGREWNAIQYLGDGSFSTSNLIGKLDCDKVTYTVTVKLIDRAENVGNPSKPVSIVTDECPRCGVSTGPMQKPLHRDESFIAYKYGYNANYFGGARPHYGVDFNGVYAGQPVYPALPGKIMTAGWDDSGYGNLVKIDHGHGLYTLYAHLLNTPSISGFVDTNTVIGEVGSSGNSSGPHLHFEIRVNCHNDLSCTVDPEGEGFLGKQGTNLTSEQYAQYCKITSTGGQHLNDIELDMELNKEAEVVSKDLTPGPPVYNAVKNKDQVKVNGVGIYQGATMKTRITYEHKKPGHFSWGMVTGEIIGGIVMGPLGVIGGGVIGYVLDDGRQVEEREEEVENTEIILYKDNFDDANRIGHLWNNDLYGHWDIYFSGLEIGQKICAKTAVYGNLDWKHPDGDSNLSYNHTEAEGTCVEVREKEIPKEKVLDVPYFNQWLEPDGGTHPPYGNWMCGAASATMVAGYFDKLTYNKSDEHDLKRYMYSDQGLGLGNPCNDLERAGTFAVTQAECNQSWFGGIQKYLGLHGHETIHHTTFDMSDIKQNIIDGKPVILSNPTHIFVVKGYKGDSILILNDPWEGSILPEDGYGSVGDGYELSISDLNFYYYITIK